MVRLIGECVLLGESVLAVVRKSITTSGLLERMFLPSTFPPILKERVINVSLLVDALKLKWCQGMLGSASQNIFTLLIR